MKRVVSISLGSATRNKKVHVTLLGEEFEIERIGTGGDMQKYKEMVAELDGKVDAFGVGGSDIYLYAGGKRYIFKEIMDLLAGAKKTPFVDGSGLKHTLERKTVTYLQENGIVDFRTKRVLLVSAVDRFGMAEALAGLAKSIVFGDLMFGLGIPIPVRSWGSVQTLAKLMLPVVVRLPFKWLYPVGEKQEKNTPAYGKYFAEADVIAGDFLFISRFMPEDLRGKIVFTNTTTAQDVVELTRRGVTMLITTTPVFEGRSFATNVMEAVLITLLGKRPEALTPEDYFRKLEELGWTPGIQQLNPAPTDASAPAAAHA